MSGIQLPNGKNYFATATGTPGVGYKLYTYVPGTSTPKDTYTTSLANVANTNPVVMDARGEAAIYWTGSYDVILKDANDVTIWGPERLEDAAGSLSTQLADTSTAGLGDALIGWGAITADVNGVRTRYATLTAAVAGIGSTVTDIVVSRDITLTGNVTIPTTARLVFTNSARVALNGLTLTVNGGFECGFRQCFSGTGLVIFSPAQGHYVLPHWWGAKGDAAINGTSGTDSTAAFLAAIAATTNTGLISGVSQIPLLVGPGNWLVGQLRWPSAFKMKGAGHEMTNFVCKPGTSGIWFDDNGSAAKVCLEGCQQYTNNEALITYPFRLGYNGVQHGVEGVVDDWWVRDANGAAGLVGIDINGNVGFYRHLASYNAPTCIRIAGIGNRAYDFVAYAPTLLGIDLTLTTLTGAEVEAPATGALAVKFTGNATIYGLLVSLANKTTLSHLVELGANATTWAVHDFNLAFGNASAWSAVTAYVIGDVVRVGSTNYTCILGNTNQTPPNATYWVVSTIVTNGNFKRANGTYFGGNATGGSRNGEAHYASTQAGQKLQCFLLSITNTAGVIQHKFTDPAGNVASNFVDKVSGASSTLSNTPTGADGSTAMSAGAKIGSASTNIIWLDTVNQDPGSGLMSPPIAFSSCGTQLTATPGFVSLNINGTTINRLQFQFNVDGSGAAFGLTTANIAAGKFVQVLYFGYIT